MTISVAIFAVARAFSAGTGTPLLVTMPICRCIAQLSCQLLMSGRCEPSRAHTFVHRKVLVDHGSQHDKNAHAAQPAACRTYAAWCSLHDAHLVSRSLAVLAQSPAR